MKKSGKHCRKNGDCGIDMYKPDGRRNTDRGRKAKKERRDTRRSSMAVERTNIFEGFGEGVSTFLAASEISIATESAVGMGCALCVVTTWEAIGGLK